jgi:NADH:ubiquinone oxidoreductase subunit 6 (subunit J)
LYVGGVVVLTAVLAMLLKQDEVKHHKLSPELSKEELTKKATHPGNKFTE